MGAGLSLDSCLFFFGKYNLIGMCMVDKIKFVI
jgi:hypothetical protein